MSAVKVAVYISNFSGKFWRILAHIMRVCAKFANFERILGKVWRILAHIMRVCAKFANFELILGNVWRILQFHAEILRFKPKFWYFCAQFFDFLCAMSARA